MYFSKTIFFSIFTFATIGHAVPLEDRDFTMEGRDISLGGEGGELAARAKTSTSSTCKRGEVFIEGRGCMPSKASYTMTCSGDGTVHIDNGLGSVVPENCRSRVKCSSSGTIQGVSAVIAGPVVNACSGICHCS